MNDPAVVLPVAEPAGRRPSWHWLKGLERGLGRRLGPERLRLIGQILRFGLVGVGGLVVDGAVIYLLIHGAGLNPYLARLWSFLVAVTFTWWFNRVFTFRGPHPGSILRQWLRFVLANGVGGLVNLGLSLLLLALSPLCVAYPVLVVAAGSLAGMGFNFTASRLLVFRRS